MFWTPHSRTDFCACITRRLDGYKSGTEPVQLAISWIAMTNALTTTRRAFPSPWFWTVWGHGFPLDFSFVLCPSCPYDWKCLERCLEELVKEYAMRGYSTDYQGFSVATAKTRSFHCLGWPWELRNLPLSNGSWISTKHQLPGERSIKKPSRPRTHKAGGFCHGYHLLCSSSLGNLWAKPTLCLDPLRDLLSRFQTSRIASYKNIVQAGELTSICLTFWEMPNVS